MIADLDETLRQLLIAEFPIRNGEIDIKFDQPKREWSSRLTKPTVNFYLYDMRENAVLRQHQWQRLGNGEGSIGARHMQMKRTPYRLDCFYMITTWANEPEDEHRLLSSTLTALFRFPILPRERLEGKLSEQPFEIQAALARHDRLTNPAEVWGALDNEMRPSVSLVVTLAVDPWTIIPTPVARTFALDAGQTEPRSGVITPGARDDTIYTVSGRITGSGADAPPLAGVQVAIRGTGFGAQSDADGRYRLRGLSAGAYTLVFWQAEGKPVEKEVQVPPTANGAYDIQI